MGNVTFIYPNPMINTPRSYVKGFALPVGSGGSALVGSDLVTTYVPGNQFVQLRIQARFLAATSNTYSLDYIFDLPNCWSWIGGVLSAAAITMSFGCFTPDLAFRVRFAPFLPVDASQSVDLPAIPSSWRLPV